MKKKKMYEHILESKTTLLSINGKILKSESVGTGTSIVSFSESEINVFELDDRFVRLMITTIVGFKPGVIFEIEMEHEQMIEFDECFSKNDILENKDIVARLVGPEVSLIVASVTDKMFQNPLIIPPSLKFKET